MAWILAWYRFRSMSDEEEAPVSLGANLASAAEAACHEKVLISLISLMTNLGISVYPVSAPLVKLTSQTIKEHFL